MLWTSSFRFAKRRTSIQVNRHSRILSKPLKPLNTYCTESAVLTELKLCMNIRVARAFKLAADIGNRHTRQQPWTIYGTKLPVTVSPESCSKKSNCIRTIRGAFRFAQSIENYHSRWQSSTYNLKALKRVFSKCASPELCSRPGSNCTGGPFRFTNILELKTVAMIAYG